MKKNLSELFGKDMYGAGALSDTLRALKSEYLAAVEAMDGKLETEYANQPSAALRDARTEALRKLDHTFSINSACIMFTDHEVTELIDDMGDVKPVFPMAANEPSKNEP